MLILTRYTGERLTIGDDIWITILGEKNGCITLGINAPKEVAVHREEIYLKLKEKNQEKRSLAIPMEQELR